MRRVLAIFVLAASCFSIGCRSRYIQATITNHSPAPLNVIQVEYPTASFGTQGLQPGESFHYRFKLLGSGPVKVTWTDAKQKEHQQTGPELQEGSEGALRVDFPSSDRADFQTDLHP